MHENVQTVVQGTNSFIFLENKIILSLWINPTNPSLRPESGNLFKNQRTLENCPVIRSDSCHNIRKLIFFFCVKLFWNHVVVDLEVNFFLDYQWPKLNEDFINEYFVKKLKN